jgi:ABC-type oligopeptide transport system ATPase subunit
MDAAESSEASKLKALSEELEKKYAIPDSPEEIERKKKEEEYRKTHMTKTQMENESVKEAILDALSICGPATVTEIMRYDSELSGYSNQRISALLRQLVDEGKVTKSVDRKACYFELA